MRTQALRSIYQLKVTLKGSKPPIWRRFQIASSDDLEDLHITLQIVMGWQNQHLHEFDSGNIRYGIPDEDFPSDILYENDYRLDQILKNEKDKLTYDYDFGDGWRHEVLLEKILPFDPETILPTCIKGKRACPPEDIGGVGGYENLLSILANPKDPEYEERLEWLGEDIDAEHFDLNEINNALQYEDQEENEFTRLDDFLLDRLNDVEIKEGDNEGILSISELHGFFTAIVSGPELIQPSKWLPMVWGDFNPEWENQQAFETIFASMVAMMNDIASILMTNTKDYEPFYQYREFENESVTIVDEWCEGYSQGISIIYEKWNLDSLDMEILLAPILAFTSQTEWTGHKLNQVESENVRKNIPENTREIHAYWLAKRSQAAPLSQPMRHNEPRTGRNDPCPCGSGKKYKKCCLH